MKLYSTILFFLFVVGFSGQIKSQDNSFKGKRCTFELLDAKNPTFSEQDLIKDISSLEGVFKCKYLKDKKIFIIYATQNISPALVHEKLIIHQLGYLHFEEQVIKVNNIEADTYEAK